LFNLCVADDSGVYGDNEEFFVAGKYESGEG
jgi:hypothetical protein